MSTIQSAETGNHIPPQQLTQALSFTPRGYHLAQKERALLQLSILPSHAHINSIAQYNFK